MVSGLEKVLSQVRKPARYAGGEWNIIRKDWDSASVKVAFAFPDVYEVGMSYLGLQILYHIINSRSDVLMERTFAPWIDMENKMRKNNIPLFSLETRRPVSDFDILAFTLQYEMTFTNVLNMIDLSGLPLRVEERGWEYPLVIAGGPCAFNPESLANFIDLFVIGEGEEVFNELLNLYKSFNREEKKDLFLFKASQIPGVYAPSLYLVEYQKDGKIRSVSPRLKGVPDKVTKRVIRNFSDVSFPNKPIVPSTEIVHDRIMLEVMRGCTRGCRFCQAGMIYRPVREKDPYKLIEQAKDLVANTGYDEISLASLSTADYSRLTEVVPKLLNEFQEQKTNISLPSLRVDAFSVTLAKEIQRIRRAGLTFAPEAGTQRLRDVINKGVTEEDLIKTASLVFNEGWFALKLYFMIGLPTERQEDLEGIARLSRLVLETGRRLGVSTGRLKVTVNVSSFVPKSHTPFQWEPQIPLEEMQAKQIMLKKLLKERGLVFRWHDSRISFLEAVLARGDRRLGPALEKAWSLGCRFDGWSECFNFDLWQKAFELSGIDPGWYAYQRYTYNDLLPWDHIGAGVDKKFLILEHMRAMEGEVTADCRYNNCSGCGLCASLEIEPEIRKG